MQDGAIVHLTEDGMQKLEVPDDHVVMHVHTSSFERGGCVFWSKRNFGYWGQDFILKLTRTLSMVC